MVLADYIVSVAARHTLEVWDVTAQMLGRCVPADKYEVIVPASDVELFRERTPRHILVSSEDDYVAEFVGYLTEKMGPGHPRFGWYLQQLIKLEAVRRHSHLSRLVIWDADTVPLGPLNLFDAEGVPVFYRGEESHGPYFDTIRALFGVEKVVDFSFVAQCMPLSGKWTVEFFAELESKHSVPWWQAIIDSIDFGQGSGFSEYETLGTFVNDRFGPLNIRPSGNWSRRGYHHFVSPLELLDSVEADQLAKQLDFLAFEDWNRPKELKNRKRRQLLTRLFRKR